MALQVDLLSIEQRTIILKTKNFQNKWHILRLSLLTYYLLDTCRYLVKLRIAITREH